MRIDRKEVFLCCVCICALISIHRDYSALLDALGLLFQIRDDYANLSSKEVDGRCTSYDHVYDPESIIVSTQKIRVFVRILQKGNSHSLSSMVSIVTLDPPSSSVSYTITLHAFLTPAHVYFNPCTL